MGPTVADLVTGIIDRIEGRPHGPGRPPMPTAEIIETILQNGIGVLITDNSKEWIKLRDKIGEGEE